MDLPVSSNPSADALTRPRRPLPIGLKVVLGLGAALAVSFMAPTLFRSTAADSSLANSQSGAGSGEQAHPVRSPATPLVDSGLLGLGPGLYQVGTDLQPGEYVLAGDSAYFKVMSKNSPDLRSILCNDAFNHRTILTLAPGTYLSFENARLFPIAKAPKLEPADSLLPEGMYKVGVDLAPGAYKVVPDGSGYLEISRNSQHLLASIVSNEVLVSERTITLKAGQYLKLASAHLLLK